jgi:predicted nucleotidyltransferase
VPGGGQLETHRCPIRIPHMGLLGLGRVQADLEAILGAKVDLVPASDLKPPSAPAPNVTS